MLVLTIEEPWRTPQAGMNLKSAAAIPSLFSFFSPKTCGAIDPDPMNVARLGTTSIGGSPSIHPIIFGHHALSRQRAQHEISSPSRKPR